MAEQDLAALQRLLDKALRDIQKDVPVIIEVEGLAFIKKNFKDEGFNTRSGVSKWKPRKTTDDKGRSITRYRTNRRGRQGSLNSYGSKIEGRALLIGHKTGGNKLSNSFRTRRTTNSVYFMTYKNYAQVHNEGSGRIPKRQFMGRSFYLNDKISNKLTRTLDKRFKR